MEHPVIKMGVAYMNIHVLRRLKEELAWAIDKRFQVTSNLKRLYR